MNKVINQDLGFLLNDSFEKITLGIKPSGKLHLGSAVTFMQGFLAMTQSPSSILDVTIVDLDFDLQRGYNFLSFQGMPAENSCYEFMIDQTFDEVESLLFEMAEYFEVDEERIQLSLFSNLAFNIQYQDIMRFLFTRDDGRKLLKETIIANSANSKSLLSPICEECYHSSTRRSRYVEEDNELYLESKCYNDQCDVSNYSVHFLEPRRVNLFYLADPIRDLIVDGLGKKTDVHILGGDYSLPYGNRGISKAQRIHNLLSQIDESPYIYTGPLLNLNQIKLGKSNKYSDLYQLERLRSKQFNWLEKLEDMFYDHQHLSQLDLSNLGHYLS